MTISDYAIADLQAKTDKMPKETLVSAYSAAVANDPVYVAHSLGYTPDAMFPDVTADMRVYATDNDRKLWTNVRVVVRGTATNTRFNLRLVKF